MEKEKAILLRRTKLTDTSLIVLWCAEHGGLVQTVARGARRPKSPFAGKLDLFYGCEIAYVRSRKSDLHNLRESAVQKPRQELATEYPRLQVAAYFVQLVEMAAERDTPVPGLYALLDRALDYLSDDPRPKAGAISRFELRLVDLIGLGESGRPPISIIGDHYGRIPHGRDAALGALDDGGT